MQICMVIPKENILSVIDLESPGTGCRRHGVYFVQVFDISFESATVRLSVNPEETALISRVYAIPYDQWNMEYVEPKRRCVTIEGSNPNE